MSTADNPQAPRHWEADVVLRDGRTAHVRPIRASDGELMQEFYARVSDESKYYRFFAPMPNLSDHDVFRFTHVDHRDRVAFVMLVAGKMIGVGRYDRIDRDSAEVAFLVEDAHQGRGIGQILLEHLAQAGRERGVKRFVAEVLPDNVKMLQTFRDAGYQVTGGFEDGVMAVEFPIDPTDTAIGVMLEREHRAEAASIEKFLNPASVAVIGATRRQDTVGHALVRNLVAGDFTGRVYAVNQAAVAVSGLPAFARVGDIPDDVDLAVVAVPADAVQDVVLDCAAKGVRGLVVISAGFAEAGPEGRERQRRLAGLARSYGLRLIGPNCLGVINTEPSISLNASLSRVMPPRGRAAFFCQSGALGSAILEKVNNRGLGLSTFVSAGNRADVSGNDLLQYWEEDTSTEVVLLYLESIGNPRKFSRIARRVSRRKPIVAVRSGWSSQGVPMGQAARMTGAPTEAVDAMFEQAGVIGVNSLDEMFDVAQLLAHQPLPRGRRVAVVGNSHALGLLAGDAAVAAGLTVERAVTLGTDASAEEFEDALDAAIDDRSVDGVVAVYIPPLNVTGEDVANVLAAVGEQSDKPLVSSFLGAEGIPELLRVPDVGGATAGRGSVPSYPAVEAAVRALAHAANYAAWLRMQKRADETAIDLSEDTVDLARAKRVVYAVLHDAEAGRELTADETKELLAAYGVDVWPAISVGTLEEATDAAESLGWSVVLKATAPHLRQRPDLAHVWRNIDTAGEMADAWGSLTSLIDHPERAGFVVQRVAPPGVPLALASLEDPLFGPVVSFGLAGPLSELLGDRSFRIPPLGPGEAGAMVREVKAAPMLFGHLGAVPVYVEKVEQILRRVAQLQDDLPQVRCLELPLVLAGEDEVTVLSAVARVEPVVDSRASSFVRRLDAPTADTIHD